MFKNIIKKVLEERGYKIVRSSSFYPADIYRDREFIKIYKVCKTYTMASLQRSFALYKAIEYILRNKIEGDLVECGVWRGGQAMIMAFTLLKEGDTKRKIWLYDTYAGMSKPAGIDIRVTDGMSVEEKWRKANKDEYNKWCYSPVEDVKKNLFSTGYPRKNIEFIKGNVERTIPGQVAKKISILRLDTDWYKSTRHELTYLFPRLSFGGVIIIDDYGYWEGVRRAVDKYVRENNVKIFLVYCDNACVLGIKQ